MRVVQEFPRAHPSDEKGQSEKVRKHKSDLMPAFFIKQEKEQGIFLLALADLYPPTPFPIGQGKGKARIHQPCLSRLSTNRGLAVTEGK